VVGTVTTAFNSVIFSVLLGELNKARSRMSSLSLDREYIGFVPCDGLHRL